MNSEPSRRERKKEETRHRIFHAAIDLFRSKGFEQTTVDDITEKADVAKGTFFNYFPRKDAVLAYLSEDRLHALEENTSVMLATDRPARDRLLDLYASSASAYEEDRALSRYVLFELLRRMFVPGEEMFMRWHDLVVRLVAQGQASGELRDDVDPTRIETVLTSLHYATLFEWVCEAPPVDERRGAGADAMHCAHSVMELQAELRARLTLALEGIAR